MSSTREVIWVGCVFSVPQHIPGFLAYISYHLGKSGAFHQPNFPILPQAMDLGSLL